MLQGYNLVVRLAHNFRE